MSSHTSLRVLDEVAKSICMPAEHRAVRYPTYPATEMTGLFDYRFNETLTVAADAPGSATNKSGTTRHVLTRDVGGTYLRDAEWKYTTSGSIKFLTEMINVIYTLADADYSYRRMCPHDTNNRFPVLNYQNKEWALVPTFINSGAVAVAGPHFAVDVFRNGVVEATANKYSVVVEWYTTDGDLHSKVLGNRTLTSLATNAVAMRVASITIPTGSVQPTEVLQCLLGFVLHNDPGVMKLLQHPYDWGVNPEYHNASAPFISTRCNSSSLLLTNVTKVLNKEGTVLGARMVGTLNGDKTTPLFNFVDVSTASATNPATRYYGALERGSYNFTVPDNESLTFVTPYNKLDDSIITPGSVVQRTYAVMTPQDRYYNIVFLTDGDAAETPSSIAVNLDLHFEFRTRSTLFQLDYSRLPIEAYHAATLAVLKAGLFYENEWHKALLNGVLKATKWAAPVLGAAAGNPAGLVAAAAKAAVSQIQRHKPAKKPAPKQSKKHKSTTKGSMKQKTLR